MAATSPAVAVHAASADAASPSVVAAPPAAAAAMLGYQEGARRRARCVPSSASPSSAPPPHLRGLELHFAPAMSGGGGAYADPFLAGVAPRCSSGLARVEYDPPGAAPRQDSRTVFGQDLAARAEAARAAGGADGGPSVRTALCPPRTAVTGVSWRPARPSGSVKEDGQPLRVGGVTLHCRAIDEEEEEEEEAGVGVGVAGAPAVAVAVDPAPEATAPPAHTQRARLACPPSAGGGRAVSELDMWHDDVFNGFSVAGCV
jgi:hypothetical protein